MNDYDSLRTLPDGSLTQDEVLALLDRLAALEGALKSIAFYDGRLDATEAARSWRTASAALSAEARARAGTPKP